MPRKKTRISTDSEPVSSDQCAGIPLFRSFPALGRSLPHVSLGAFPTPVRELRSLGQHLGIGRLFAKRDDVSGTLYGGNKVRKLEFTLADALRKGSRRVITFGAAGSNHALATALYAQSVGLQCVSLLMPQENSSRLRRNLLAGLKAGADLRLFPLGTDLGAVARDLCKTFRMQDGVEPYIIPPGGSSALGAVGFVNAAFELREQIDAGLLPVPDRIYLAWGTMGTAAGLSVGLAAQDLPTHLVCVRVVPDFVANEGLFRQSLSQLISLLTTADPRFSEADPTNWTARHDQFGEDYARITVAAQEAIDLVKGTDGLGLEGTYTAKAFAALIADARAGLLRSKTVVFWSTYSSRDLDTEGVDYHALPGEFHPYFEEPEHRSS